MLERVSSLLISFFVTLAVARYLLPETFGRLSYLLALVSLLVPLMSLGLNSLVSRELLRRPVDGDTIMGSALALRCIASLIVVTIILVFTRSFTFLPERDLFMFLSLCSLFSALFVVDFWLQAYVANRYGVILRQITLLMFGGARLVAVELDAGLSAFVYIAGLEIACLGLFYVCTYQRLSGGIKRLRASWTESSRLWKDSRWLMISGVAAVIYLKVDQVMLGMMIGNEAVGIYAVAARLSEVWYFLPSAVAISFFPQLIKKKEKDSAEYWLDLQKINDALCCSGVAVAIIVSLNAYWGLQLLFGIAYSEAVPILVVHVWAGVFVFMRALLSKWLIAEDLIKLSMLSQTLGAIANLCFNYYLIPLYGPLGAAYATIISCVIAGYIVLFCHRDLWPMAIIVTKSILLPYRLATKGQGLYKSKN
ncbi:MAG: flippase [Porticoccaceae bacterium]|nr:flippase [Porticoccaceae bacterium]